MNKKYLTGFVAFLFLISSPAFAIPSLVMQNSYVSNYKVLEYYGFSESEASSMCRNNFCDTDDGIVETVEILQAHNFSHDEILKLMHFDPPKYDEPSPPTYPPNNDK